ncbi:MAG: HAD family hydrolase [Candidatus Hodarchaeota archaeon]
MIKTLFLDLHGVLADPNLVYQNYTEMLAEILAPTGISYCEAEKIHQQAFDYWLIEFENVAKATRSANVEGYFVAKAREMDEKYTEFILQNIPSSYKAMDELRHQLSPESLEYHAARRKNTFYPDVEETLTYLYQNFEGRIICASDAHSRHVRGCLEAGNAIDYFDEIIGYDVVQCHKLTPKNSYVQKVIKITNSNPQTCIFVDNSVKTLQDALKLGMKVILMNRDKKQIENGNIRTTIFDFSQLSCFLLE